MAVALPISLEHAVDTLVADPHVTVLAGGTDLMVEVNEGVRRLDTVVSLQRVAELRQWHLTDDEVVLGAGVSFAALASLELARALPALTAAARTVGSPQIRNAGTIGGNLATASPAGDTLPVLVALGASVDLVGPSGWRSLAVRDFLVGPKRTALGPNELIARVRVPRWRGPQEFMKVGTRNAMVIAIASLAFAVDLDSRQVGVALGSVGPTVVDATEAAAWLAERLKWSADGIALADALDVDRFAAAVAAVSAPIDDHRSSAAYRRRAVEVLARRALRRAMT
jgi:CO/xanthine dehydrogenase FAD-binding subunit